MPYAKAVTVRRLPWGSYALPANPDGLDPSVIIDCSQRDHNGLFLNAINRTNRPFK